MRLPVILIISLFVFSACKNNVKDNVPKEVTLDNIKQLRDSLIANPVGESFKTKAPLLVKMLDSYATSNPKDSLSPGYIFEAAQYSRNLGDYNTALTYLDKIIAQYPDFARMPDVMFFEAFMVENDIKNLPKAKAIYEAFLKRYPNHAYAANIRLNLMNLGKTPEEVLKSIKNRPQ